MASDKSPYLSFLVAVHVATAVALVVFYRRDWARITFGLISSIRDRRITTSSQRLGWLLIAATIPVGVVGLLFEHVIRTALGRPVLAALFLTANGVLLYGVETLRNRSTTGTCATMTATTAADGEVGGVGATDGRLGVSGIHVTRTAVAEARRNVESGAVTDDRIGHLGWGEAVGIGAAQILALLPGISRSGATIAAGLMRGLDHEDAARFAFLLATPVILAAGLLKLPELAGPEGQGILGQVAAGSLVAGVAAYLSLRFLTRYFHTHTLTPFAIYSTVAGLLSLTWLTLV